MGSGLVLPRAVADVADTGSISGMVFEDENGDGLKDPADKGVEHWAMYLVDLPWFIVNTDANGIFTFTDVPVGTHMVCLDHEDLWQQTAPLPPAGTHCGPEVLGFVAEVAAGATTSGLNFGMFHAFTITGKTFEDMNGNGKFDTLAIDKNLPGREIRLRRSDGSLPITCISGQAGQTATIIGNACVVITDDNNGNYKFKNVGLGEYVITQTPVRGWIQTLPASTSTMSASYVLLGESNDTHTRDFGNYKMGVIKGTVVHDRNATGFWERGELPLSGWTIVLTRPDGSQSTMLTDMSGKYEFSKLAIGTSTVSQVLPPEWEQTAPSFPSYTLPLVSGSTLYKADFLNHWIGKIE